MGISMSGKIYIGSVGIEIAISTGINLTNATSYKFRVLKPDGNEIEWSASIVDMVSGVLSYTTVEGDLDVVGTWKLNARVAFPGEVFYGETTIFQVFDKFK
jgi:hypothetical protein